MYFAVDSIYRASLFIVSSLPILCENCMSIFVQKLFLSKPTYILNNSKAYILFNLFGYFTYWLVKNAIQLPRAHSMGLSCTNWGTIYKDLELLIDHYCNKRSQLMIGYAKKWKSFIQVYFFNLFQGYLI